ncbi:MAG: hypothetical protein NZ896_05015 [Nitrososphaerales archaeon]|nr:hypothetical protein [Nitrososphaerales archaeon]
MKSILDNDPIAKFLFERSALTYSQLDTYLIDSMSDMRLEEKIMLRDGKRVSKGSFLRTLKQAQMNVRKAFYTLILMEYLKILESGTTSGLIEVGKTLDRVKESSPTFEHIKRVLEVIDVTLNRLSTPISRRRDIT